MESNVGDHDEENRVEDVGLVEVSIALIHDVLLERADRRVLILNELDPMLMLHRVKLGIIEPILGGHGVDDGLVPELLAVLVFLPVSVLPVVVVQVM